MSSYVLNVGSSFCTVNPARVYVNFMCTQTSTQLENTKKVIEVNSALIIFASFIFLFGLYKHW